jgi:hypothetical protein
MSSARVCFRRAIVVGKSESPNQQKTDIPIRMEKPAEKQLPVPNICAKISPERQNKTSPGLFGSSIAGPGKNG